MIVPTWQYSCLTAQLPNSILTDKVTGKRVKKKTGYGLQTTFICIYIETE